MDKVFWVIWSVFNGSKKAIKYHLLKLQIDLDQWLSGPRNMIQRFVLNLLGHHNEDKTVDDYFKQWIEESEWLNL